MFILRFRNQFMILFLEVGRLGSREYSSGEMTWIRLPFMLGACPSFLPSLPTCVMYYIGCLDLSADNNNIITYTVSYHCNGLPLCPSLPPFLLSRPLLPSIQWRS